MGTTIQTKFSLSIFLKRVEKLNSCQRAAIERVGFGSLLRIPSHGIAKTLIAYLIDKWSSKKQAFLFANGEVSITPLDVALIMGIRITGKAVALHEDNIFLELERHHLFDANSKTIKLKSLEKSLDSPICQSDESKFIRVFLLFTFATVLFPNTSQTVDSRYMPLLRNVDCIHEYAWGLALLNDLFKWITLRKDRGATYVGGCLLLLQVIFNLSNVTSSSFIQQLFFGFFSLFFIQF